MLEDLKTYDYSAHEYRRMTGTEDWVEVASMGEGGYDWTEFKAFYSPSARRYFWHGDSGCSCNSWSDDLSSADSFQNGSLDDLLRAWETFAKYHEWRITTTDYLNGVASIRAFRAPSIAAHFSA